MNTEQIILKSPPDLKIDYEWVDMIEDGDLSFAGYEILSPTKTHLDEEKEAFLKSRDSGQTYIPDLTPKIRKITLLSYRIKLNLVKSYLTRVIKNKIKGIEYQPSDEETNLSSLLPNLDENHSVEQLQIIGHLYISKLNSKIVEVNSLLASQSGDMASFVAFNKYLYGDPDTNMFQHTVNTSIQACEKSLMSEDPHERELAANLLNWLNPIRKNLNRILPMANHRHDNVDEKDQYYLVEKLRDHLVLIMSGVFDETFNPENSEQLLDAETSKKYFELLLSQASLLGDDWSVEIVDSGLFSVDQLNKRLKVPQSSKLTPQRLCELFAHEGLKHIQSRIKGEQSYFKLLGYGLPNYDKGEEGVATLFEQALQGNASEIHHLDRHLAIAIASGIDKTGSVDNSSIRDFRETFDVMQAYYEYDRYVNKQQDSERAYKNSLIAAWTRGWRTYRGTDGSTGFYAKDMVYAKGNKQVREVVFEWLLENEVEDIYYLVTLGKWNVGDKIQLGYLVKLGIVDSKFLNYTVE